MPNCVSGLKLASFVREQFMTQRPTNESHMKIVLMSYAVAVVATALACQQSNADQTTEERRSVPAARNNQTPAYAPAVLREKVPVDRAAEDKRFADAARAAWALIDRAYYPATGLASAQPNWAYPTTWDAASALAAYFSARGLGLISDEEYKQRATRALTTFKNARLYNGIAYGRNYDAKTGELVGPDQKPHPNGTGYSAIDVGRLLVVLKIIATHDADLAPAAEAVARRVDAGRALRGGYMMGEELSKKTGKPNNYQEGRIGYEQYSATGFTLWGMPAANAVNARNNAIKATVLGIPITGDRRGLDRITSEPFILHGLELGFDQQMRELAWQTLSAQAARYSSTGQMTMASEDAINRAPYYFYYYCVYCTKKPFVINVHSPGIDLSDPRWISTKAAFAWHALMPSKYTWLALDAVQPALASNGWATGVFEATKKSTETYSLNTAAVILEAALYRKTGKPLIQAAR